MSYITEPILGKNIDRVLISEVEIDSAVRRIAAEIDDFSAVCFQHSSEFRVGRF